MNVADVEELVVYPDATAIASTVSDVETENGAVYLVELTVGVEPLVV